MTTFDTLQKHQILNCGDMDKDGKINPSIINNPLFIKAKKIITGDFNCDSVNTAEFKNLIDLINEKLLNNVKKYCYGTLLPIPEEDTLDNDPKIQTINKNSRKVVPVNVTNAFIDAAVTPSNYYMASEIKIYETPASNIDAGTRRETENFYPEVNTSYPLEQYGFKKGSTFNYIKDNNKDDYKYIEIILDSDNYFKGLVNREGQLGDTYEVSLAGDVYSKDNAGTLKSIFENLFKGNTKKNTYISENDHTSAVYIQMLSTLLIFFKELGDTTQAIVLRKIFDEGNSSIRKENTSLLSIDTVLACRCAILNVPYLLKSNSIITYYAAIDEAIYEKNMKLNEIKKTKIHNEEIIKEYTELLATIDRDSNVIFIEDARYVISDEVKNRFKKIIDCIRESNLFLDKLKEQLETNEIISTILTIIRVKTDYKELTEQSFNEFRKIVVSLKAVSIFIYRGKKRKIITGKYFVFAQKLTIKEKYFTLKKYINDIIFNDGVVNFIKISDRNNKKKGGTKEIDTGDFKQDEYEILSCYSLLYPYIYCNPYLLPYILKKEGQELMEFLNTIITNILLPDYNDKKEPINNSIIPNLIPDGEINNLYSEELLYNFKHFEKVDNKDEIDNYQIYTNVLLNKLHDFVKKNPDISKLLESNPEESLASSSFEEVPDASPLPPAPILTVKTDFTRDMDIDSSPPPETPPSQIRQAPLVPEQTPTKKASYGKRQRLHQEETNRSGTPKLKRGGKKTKNKNKKTINKKSKKKYKSKSKIVYKKKNTKKRITKKKKINKKVKNTKKIKK